MFRSTDSLKVLGESKTTTFVTINLNLKYNVKRLADLTGEGFLGRFWISCGDTGRRYGAVRRLSARVGRFPRLEYD